MPLYLVSTPLGNLADLSARAKETLARAAILAAEDTRAARRLLSALEIPLRGRTLLSYGEHNEARMAARLAKALEAGRDVALFSEGGTPLISDPGYRLVRAAIEADVPVVPVAGPCAAIAALCASGLPVHGFLFRGFLPKRPGVRRKMLEDLKEREETLIFYESARRVPKLLAELVDVFGAERPACLARELTKLHETFLRGKLGALLVQISGGKPIKGQCTILVGGVKSFDKRV